MKMEHNNNELPVFGNTSSSGDVWVISESLWDGSQSEEEQPVSPEQDEARQINAVSIQDQPSNRDMILPLVTEYSELTEDGVMIRGKIYEGIKPIPFDAFSMLFGLVAQADEGNSGLTQEEKNRILDYLRRRLTWK